MRGLMFYSHHPKSTLHQAFDKLTSPIDPSAYHIHNSLYFCEKEKEMEHKARSVQKKILSDGNEMKRILVLLGGKKGCLGVIYT
jgi:hypothetical protein